MAIEGSFYVAVRQVSNILKYPIPQQQKELPFPLLSDPQRVFIKALGAFKPPKSTSRSHFVFEKDSGKLVEKKSSVKPAERLDSS
jgi:peroxiredoxin